MKTTEDPPWRAEILEKKKRVEKMKAETTPGWKVDLLKRLRTKAEAARQRKGSEVKLQDEKPVVDEHILKVSENVFMRKELERRMSSGRLTTNNKQHSVESSLPRSRVDKSSENIVKNGEVVGNELPSAGIVSRLKGVFTYDANRNAAPVKATAKSTHFVSMRVRSQSNDDIFKIGDKKSPKKTRHTPISPLNSAYPRSHPISPVNKDIKPASPQDKDLSTSLASADVVALRGYQVTTSLNLPAELHQKDQQNTQRPQIKKYSTPLSPSRKPASIIKSKSLDLASVATDCEADRMADRASFPGKSTERKIVPAEDVTLLRHTVIPGQNAGGDEIAIEPEKLTLGPVATTEVSSSSHRGNKLSNTSGEQKFNFTTVPKATQEKPAQQNIRSSLLENMQKSTITETDKENMPEVLKRRQISYSKMRASDKVLDHNRPPVSRTSGGGRIVDLGRISMDPSLLRSKGAIAANEIMKESKTLLIIPRNKDSAATKSKQEILKKQNKVVTKSEKLLSKSNFQEDETTKSKDNPANNALVNDVSTRTNPSLPVSSIDDVIGESSPNDIKPVVFQSKSIESSAKTQSIKTVAEDKTKETLAKTTKTSPATNLATNNIPKQNNVRSFVVASSKKSVVINRGSDSENAVCSVFGTKLNGTGNNKGFGGRSFTIDPRKFKKSSAQSTTSNSNHVTLKSEVKTTSASVSANTKIISPRTSTDHTATETSKADETPTTPKGKRKLTVDQIIVVGGYVKLDHSTLSKPNKIRKEAHVKFEESHLEEVYQYPSESSLLRDEHQSDLNRKMTALAQSSVVATTKKEETYSARDLLSGKQKINDEDEDDAVSRDKPVDQQEQDVKGEDAIPLHEKDPNAFSFSSSDDLLF